MPISVETIRELLARNEGPALDFKATHYPGTNSGNAEMAKDVMAISNGLSPHASLGHILIGVNENSDKTGFVVGVDPNSHLDDASMQQKVKAILNRTPKFSYSSIEIDGLSVGVFEILPGGRPYYPLKDYPPNAHGNKLNRFVALVRLGTSTDAASPDQIRSWIREDDEATRFERLHEGLSRCLGFLAEAIEGGPFHWSKHAIHCDPLSSRIERLSAIKLGIETLSFEMNYLQIKLFVDSVHEASAAILALVPAAFQLSSEHGLIWLSINSSVSQLASLYPFKSDRQALDSRRIRIGEDTFPLAFYELIEQLLRFEGAA